MAIDDIISTNSKPRREGPGSRRSATRALAAASVALLAGGVAVFLMKGYLARKQIGSNMTPVVVAKMNIPLATVLRAEHLTVTAWPKTARPEGTYQDPKELVGRVLMARVFQSEVILAAKVAKRDAGSGLAALIPENMRAAAVRVDDVVGVAGFIHPEDRVDVIVTMRAERNGESTAKVILQNVRVLAVGKQIEEQDQRKKSKPIPVTVATLLVTTEQSEKLALAAAQGKLLLTLRSGTDQNEIPTSGIVPTTLLAGGAVAQAEPVKAKAEESSPPPRAYHRVRATPTTQAPVTSVPVAERREVVEILRGDRFEQRKFEAREAQ